jgi:CheY-like chemotaxis protein
MKKILFIDDDKYGVITYLIEELQLNNYEVSFRNEIDGLLGHISDNHYDLLILDIMLPVPDSWNSEMQLASNSGIKTGVVLFNLIRKSFPILPVIIYSAYSHDIKHDNYTYSIRKPELPSVIIQKLEELLAKYSE